MQLLCNTPKAAGENTPGMPVTTETASDCHTVRGAVGCDSQVFSDHQAALVLEYSEIPDTVWSSDRFAGRFAGRQFAVEDGQAKPSGVQEIPWMDNAAVMPADEKPPGAKVPEPATMVLLATGLITTSRVARAKRQPRKQ
jgi:PEP-CTERM motif